MDSSNYNHMRLDLRRTPAAAARHTLLRALLLTLLTAVLAVSAILAMDRLHIPLPIVDEFAVPAPITRP